MESYQFRDEKGKDQGINGAPCRRGPRAAAAASAHTCGAAVRHKAKEICALLQDDERLREERLKARRNQNKYVGISSEDTAGVCVCRACCVVRERATGCLWI